MRGSGCYGNHDFENQKYSAVGVQKCARQNQSHDWWMKHDVCQISGTGHNIGSFVTQFLELSRNLSYVPQIFTFTNVY